RLPPPSGVLLYPTATPYSSTLSLHDALPICARGRAHRGVRRGDSRVSVDARPVSVRARASPALFRRAARAVPLGRHGAVDDLRRSEEHTSELQSLTNLVCRLLLEHRNHGPHP